jgi:hypothetical protein
MIGEPPVYRKLILSTGHGRWRGVGFEKQINPEKDSGQAVQHETLNAQHSRGWGEGKYDGKRARTAAPAFATSALRGRVSTSLRLYQRPAMSKRRMELARNMHSAKRTPQLSGAL